MGKEEPHVLDIVGPEELSTSDRMFLTLAAFKNTIWLSGLMLAVMIIIIIASVSVFSNIENAPPGIVVLDLIDGFGAKSAGIQVGDKIIAVADVQITNNGDLPRLIIGETVDVTVIRGDEFLTIPVEIMPDPENDSHAMLGIFWEDRRVQDGEVVYWWTVILLSIPVVGIFIWSVTRGRKWSGTANILRRQHRIESYFSTLSLATRETDDISLDFFNIAVDVFPELKQHESKINQESGEIELESMTLEKKNNYKFDVWEDTKEGTFLIKSFPHNAPKMKVTYEQIEKAAKLAKEEPGDCLRLVCLADAFESKAVEEISKIEEKMEFKVPIDLILGNSIGFSAVRISPLNPE